MVPPTRATITAWASGLFVGLCGVAIGATAVALSQNASSPKNEAPPHPLPQLPRVTVYRAGAKGHLYRVGTNFFGAGWQPVDSVAYVDELMVMRLKGMAVAWSGGGESVGIRFADNTELSLLPAPEVSAPEQIGRLFLARGPEQVLILLKKCKEIVDRGAGVDTPLEAIV